VVATSLERRAKRKQARDVLTLDQLGLAIDAKMMMLRACPGEAGWVDRLGQPHLRSRTGDGHLAVMQLPGSPPRRPRVLDALG
jgi:hypothetical protein